MLLALLVVAVVHAVCIAQPPSTQLPQTQLGRTTPLAAFSTWGSAEHLAGRLRVRGPDGALVAVRAEALGFHVQLVPLQPWAPGTHTVEERGDYGADRRRLTTGGGDVRHRVWFPVKTVEVVEAPSRLAPLEDVRWERLDGREVSGRLQVPEAVLWVDLEVDGMGPIYRTYRRGGEAYLFNGAHVRCNDTHRTQWLDSGEPVSVRAVAHGDGGARHASEWTVLPRRRTQRPPAGDRMSSWREVPDVSRSTGSPVVPGGDCGALVVRSTEERRVDHDSAWLVDDDGVLREVEARAHGVRIGERTIRGLTSPLRALAVHGESWVVATEEGTELVLVDAGKVLARRAMPPGFTVASLAFAETVDVVAQDDDGVRWSLSLDASLRPLAEWATVRRPIQVTRGHDGHTWRVNGVAVELE